MENKNAKKSIKNQNKMKSTRLSPETLRKADQVLQMANKKSAGRKIKLDQVLCVALDLVNEEHLKELQSRSLTNSDRREILRKKYSELHGPVTSEEFIGITMTPLFFDFLKEHGHIVSVV
ncbi:MAG: hypothetical protein KF865_11335 [Bdellovibrionaceae bacterium]|nr:hypothetical protein [Pseudobdellovibrionaceae bacterium]